MPTQTEIATKEFCPKSLLRKQNEIDFIESHILFLEHVNHKKSHADWTNQYILEQVNREEK